MQPKVTFSFVSKIQLSNISNEISVIDNFGIDIGKDTNSSLVLKDNLGTLIPTYALSDIIQTYHSGSSFFVNAVIESTQSRVAMVTPFILENYFINNYNALLSFKENAELSNKERRQIVNATVSFMCEIFGIRNVTKARKIMTARAVVSLFPALKDKKAEDEGIVCILIFKL